MRWYQNRSAKNSGLVGGYAHQCDDGEFGEARIVELPDRESAKLRCQECGVMEILGAVELPEIWLQEPRAVAEIIRDMRLSEAGRTQAEFAEIAGVTSRAVRAWEAGDYKPRGSQLAALRMLMPKELVAELMDAWRREKAGSDRHSHRRKEKKVAPTLDNLHITKEEDGYYFCFAGTKDGLYSESPDIGPFDSAEEARESAEAWLREAEATDTVEELER